MESVFQNNRSHVLWTGSRLFKPTNAAGNSRVEPEFLPFYIKKTVQLRLRLFCCVPLKEIQRVIETVKRTNRTSTVLKTDLFIANDGLLLDVYCKNQVGLHCLYEKHIFCFEKWNKSMNLNQIREKLVPPLTSVQHFQVFVPMEAWLLPFSRSGTGTNQPFFSLPLKEKRLEPQRNPRESSAVFMLVFTLCSKSSKRQDSTEVQEPVLERLKTTVTSVCRRPLYLCISPGWTYVKALRI